MDSQNNLISKESLGQHMSGSKPYKKSKGYYIKRHLSPEGVVEREEFLEPTEVNLRNRDTQTPIREIVNEECQYDTNDPNLPEAKFTNRLNQRLSADEMASSQDHPLPFSTIKK